VTSLIMAPITVSSLAPEDLAYFLMRYRRGETLERYEPRLDNFLRDILSKANEFVPSESGAILLDDPQAKMFSSGSNQLTMVTAFGQESDRICSQRVSCDRGLLGQVYQTGHSAIHSVESDGEASAEELGGKTGLQIRSLLGVPVVLGNAVCGVLLLINRLGQSSYAEGDRALIKIFAGYISSSIQNMLDGIRARELARRDDLTGLFNDRYLHYRLREEISRADSAGTDLALVFLDLDRFKEINDHCGHIEGSRALREMGILIENELPTGAVAARYGGDEFVVILPGADMPAAEEFAERLLMRRRAAPFLAGKLSGTGEVGRIVTASIGVASLRVHVAEGGGIAERANALIRRADTAMYRAKAEGRNRVVVAQYKTKEYPVAAASRREQADTSNHRPAEPGRGSAPGAAVDLPRATASLRPDPGQRRPR
jgi:diguanylate cyclase (GGDEF)-like protein